MARSQDRIPHTDEDRGRTAARARYLTDRRARWPWLPWELRAGATAVMTGFAFPEFMAATVRAALAGDWASAFETHDFALPLIVWEAQPVVGLAHRKAMLVERGVIATTNVRAPLPATPRAAPDAAELASRLTVRRVRTT